MFDHIREKAKNFPVLAPSNVVRSPSSEPLILTRKRAREKQLEPYNEVEVLEELEWNKIPRWAVVNPSSESKETEQNQNNLMDERGDDTQTHSQSLFWFLYMLGGVFNLYASFFY